MHASLVYVLNLRLAFVHFDGKQSPPLTADVSGGGYGRRDCTLFCLFSSPPSRALEYGNMKFVGLRFGLLLQLSSHFKGKI